MWLSPFAPVAQMRRRCGNPFNVNVPNDIWSKKLWTSLWTMTLVYGAITTNTRGTIIYQYEQSYLYQLSFARLILDSHNLPNVNQPKDYLIFTTYVAGVWPYLKDGFLFGQSSFLGMVRPIVQVPICFSLKEVTVCWPLCLDGS